jgi:nitrite reductase (NADH) small subunit
MPVFQAALRASMNGFQTVCKVQDLPEGEGKIVPFGRKSIYAVDDVCPHMGASLGSGHVEGDTVTCPWHAWRFRLSDGVWADYPKGKVKIGCYVVRVEGDDVQIELPPVEP